MTILGYPGSSFTFLFILSAFFWTIYKYASLLLGDEWLREGKKKEKGKKSSIMLLSAMCWFLASVRHQFHQSWYGKASCFVLSSCSDSSTVVLKISRVWKQRYKLWKSSQSNYSLRYMNSVKLRSSSNLVSDCLWVTFGHTFHIVILLSSDCWLEWSYILASGSR